MVWMVVVAVALLALVFVAALLVILGRTQTMRTVGFVLCLVCIVAGIIAPHVLHV